MRSVLITMLSLALAACYYVPQQAGNGTVSLQITVPSSRALQDGDYLVVSLYDPADVTASSLCSPGLDLEVATSGDSISIGGAGEFLVPVDAQAGSGALLIPGIEAGRRIRMLVEISTYTRGTLSPPVWNGLSDVFVVDAGGETPVTVILYYPDASPCS